MKVAECRAIENLLRTYRPLPKIAFYNQKKSTLGH